MFRSSKVVGSVEIAWNDLLASPTLSINRWYPLIPAATISGGSELLAPSLHLAISLKSVDSVSQQAPQEHDQEAMSCRNEMRKNYVNVNVNRRIRRLERDDCGCRRKVCCQGLHEDFNPCKALLMTVTDHICTIRHELLVMIIYKILIIS